MNIEKIKEIVQDNQNRTINFRFNGNRNQSEEFKGKIVDAYKTVFLIKLDNNMIRPFTYTDVLIGNLEIKV